MLSLRHIESQTLIALDRTFCPTPKHKKKVQFKIEERKNALAMTQAKIQIINGLNGEKKINILEEGDTTSDLEENEGNKARKLKTRDRKRKTRKFKRDLVIPVNADDAKSNAE